MIPSDVILISSFDFVNLEKLLKTPELRQLIKFDEKFDLILT